MSYHKLGRAFGQRKAILHNSTTDLSINGRIVTTEARVKEVRPTAEETVILGKRGDLHAYRQAAALVRNKVANVRKENEDTAIKSVLQELLNDTALRYAERQGGCIRILKTGPGYGDGASMAILELV